jgi:cytidine deaminase
MQKKEFQFSFEIYNSIAELDREDAMLLREAQKATEYSYAPYSKFRVGAVAKLSDGKIVSGANQENASFPAGICAERVLLSSVSSLHSNAHIETIAISYKNENGKSNHPISPCGICRQSLQEYEQRMKRPIRLILGGMQGEIYILPNTAVLLPLAFTSDELK